jgi:hypothetical protein
VTDRAGSELLLFVGGAPGWDDADRSGEHARREAEAQLGALRRPVHWIGRELRQIIGLRLPEPPESAPPPGATPQEPWHIPRELVQCVKLAQDAARREGRTIVVVDVNRPERHKDLVDRWIGPNTVLPLLVRTDGARLEGSEEFVPKKVRQFVEGR